MYIYISCTWQCMTVYGIGPHTKKNVFTRFNVDFLFHFHSSSVYFIVYECALLLSTAVSNFCCWQPITHMRKCWPETSYGHETLQHLLVDLITETSIPIMSTYVGLRFLDGLRMS